MAYTRRSYSGNAPTTNLSGGLTNAATSFTVLSGTGYPDGSEAPFVVCIDRGNASEEKILCSARSGATFTVASSGRGWDGTPAAAHSSPATVDHVFDAQDADEANQAVVVTLGTAALVVNVKGPSIGAHGDGIADDTTAIQAAVTAAVNAGGGTVFFPAGTYLLGTGPLTVPSHVSLLGAGPQISIIKQGFALPGSVDGNAMVVNSDTISGNDGVHLRDLQILATALVGVSPTITNSTQCLNLKGVSNFTADNCWFVNGVCSHQPLPATVNTPTVNSTGNNTNVAYRGCQFNSGSESIFWEQGTGLLVEQCQLLNAFDSTLSVNSSGEQIVLVGNVFDKRGNTFGALAHIELTNDGAGDTNGIRDVTITGNLLLNAANTGVRSVLAQTVSHLVVTGNDVRNNKGTAIWIASGSSQVTIAGNSIDVPAGVNAHAVQIVNDGAAGCSDVLVSGNTITDASTDAIYTGGGAKTLANVAIIGNRAKAAVNSGIRNDAPVTNGLVADNLVAGGSGGINQGAGTGWTYRGNIGYNPVGHAVAQPSVPATTVAATNTTGVDCTVAVSAGASTCTVAIGGTTAFVVPSAGIASIRVPAGQTVTLTYASAPTWQWFGD